MVRFKVVKNKNGGRDIHQVSTGERKETAPRKDDFADLDAALEKDDAIAGNIDTSKDPPAGDELPADPPEGEVYARLVEGLHENNVDWAKGWIHELDHPSQVDRLRTLEREHPKHEGGRSGVLQALDNRKHELMAPGETPQALQPQASGLPCERCDFVAGSEAGLEGHMEAHHAGT